MCRRDGTNGGADSGVFFLMSRRTPRTTQSRSSAALGVYKRKELQS